jgi:hypothetical protein
VNLLGLQATELTGASSGSWYTIESLGQLENRMSGLEDKVDKLEHSDNNIKV